MERSSIFRGQPPTDAEIVDTRGNRPGIRDQYLCRFEPAWLDKGCIMVVRHATDDGVAWVALAPDGDTQMIPPEDAEMCEAVFCDLRIPNTWIAANCTVEAAKRR